MTTDERVNEMLSNTVDRLHERDRREADEIKGDKPCMCNHDKADHNFGVGHCTRGYCQCGIYRPDTLNARGETIQEELDRNR
jgi:hypothetical protein